MRNLVLTALTAVVIAIPAAHASPLELKRIPAEAVAVGHIDIDTLRKTSFYRPLGIAKELAGLDKKYEPIVERIIVSCQSATMWIGEKRPTRTGVSGAHKKRAKSASGKSGDESDHEAALLLEFPSASTASEVLAAIVKLGHGKKVGDNRYSISDDGDTFELVSVGNVLAVSDNPVILNKTLSAIAGKTPTLTEKALPGGAADHGVFFFVGLGDSLLQDIKKAADSALLKTDISSFALNLGEVGPDLRGRVVAVMTSADGAQKVKSVVDGLIALISLAEESKPFQPIEKYLKTAVDGKTVTVTVSVPTAELIKALKSLDDSNNP